MSSVKSLGIGIIGYGYSARHIHIPLFQILKQTFSIVAIASPSFESRQLAQLQLVTSTSDFSQTNHENKNLHIYEKYEELLTDQHVDIVLITTPTQTHFEIAQQALLANKHVVVDKPIAVKAQQVLALQQLAEQQQRLITVFHNRRWDSDYLTLLSLIKQDKFGDIKWIEMSYQKGFPSKLWKAQSVNEGGGRFWDLGVHMIDQLLLIIPSKVTSVYCRMLHENTDMPLADSHAMCMINFANNEVGVIDTGSTTTIEKPRFYVVGNKATWIKNGQDPQEAALAKGHLQPVQEDEKMYGELVYVDKKRLPRSERTPTQLGHWTSLYENIANTLRGDDSLIVTLSSVARVTAVMEAALQSAQNNTVISVNI